MANRFFAFGCSFTAHCWPTWAHCSAELHRRMGIVDYTYNFGVTGASNKVIAHTVLLAKAVHNIDSEDIVYIMWTTSDRTDCWGSHNQSHAGWKPQGSIHHSDALPKTIQQTYTPQGFHTDSLMYKRIVREVLPHAVHCAWRGDHEINILDTWFNTDNSTISVPQWGIEHMRSGLDSSENSLNPAQQHIGTDTLWSTRGEGHEPFLATDALIDPHPHPQAHLECATNTFSMALTGGAEQSERFNTVVKEVGSEIIKYTNTVNKQHTDAYKQLHEASNETPVLYAQSQNGTVEHRTLAHDQFLKDPVYYDAFEQANLTTPLNYNMVPVPGVNHRGMHRNTFGDLWYDAKHSSQDMLHTVNTYGIEYDALATELYEEWCDAILPSFGG